MKPRRTAKRTDESPENVVARLAKKLPEGYEIVNMADAIRFDSPEPKQEQQPPPPPKGSRVVFEKDRLWDDDDVEERKARLSKPLPFPHIPGSMWPWQLSMDQVEAFAERFGNEWHQLTNTALHAKDTTTKDAAGRAVANIVSEVLKAWPETKELQAELVSETIRRIKSDNEGFKRRWHKELHIKGVAKKRTKKGDKQLQGFVSNAEMRLGMLEREVIDYVFAVLGKYSSEPFIASWNEAVVLMAWMMDIPGVEAILRVVQEDRLTTWEAQSRIQKIIGKAKAGDVEDYFRKVFRPALENGFWHKWGDLPEGNFANWQGVMLTMLKVEVYRHAD
jgi:hypothetical protein